jgi:formamidopyrimidine-DNA glycosylase
MTAGNLPAVLFNQTMPELPEVETIVRSLRDPGGLPGKRIASAEVLWAKTVAEPTPDIFTTRIVGRTIRAVERRAKFILLSLDEGNLLIHLRMSGDLRVEAADAELLKHDRLLITFTDGTRLVFNDARKFGRAWLVQESQSVLGALGPEPFDPLLTGEVLHEHIHGSKRKIKTLLLDQSMIAGIGNIYSDEALHRAKLHPETAGVDVSMVQAEALLSAIRETLEEGIKRNGASIDWVYRGGDFQNHFRVYQRTGEPCPVCGTKIERKVIGQRSAHFCPKCQRPR